MKYVVHISQAYIITKKCTYILLGECNGKLSVWP